MFVSVPAYRFPIPARLAQPGADYWRALTTSVNSAWYILSLQVEEEGVSRIVTLLFWWDSDVVAAIEQFDPIKIESLICVLPVTQGGDACRQASVAIREIWEVDAGEEHGDHPVFVDFDGLERLGMWAEPLSERVPRRRRIAMIGEAGTKFAPVARDPD